MMSYTAAGQLSPHAITHRDALESVSTQHKQDLRATYLDKSYKIIEGADSWETTGMGVELIVEEKNIVDGVGMLAGKQGGEKNGKLI